MSNLGKKAKAAINSTINKITTAATGTPFLVTGIQDLDQSGEENISLDVINDILDKVAAKWPDTVILIVTAGKTSCTGVAHVPNNYNNKLDAVAWLQSCGLHCGDQTPVNQSPVDNDDANGTTTATATAASTCARPWGTAESDSPIKTKDIIISKSFVYLRQQNLLVEEESDDELPFNFNDV